MEALSSIDEQVVPMFREAAKSLLAELEPEVALALALAKITGHTQLRVSYGDVRVLVAAVSAICWLWCCASQCCEGEPCWQSTSNRWSCTGHTQLQADPGLRPMSSDGMQVAMCGHELNLYVSLFVK